MRTPSDPDTSDRSPAQTPAPLPPAVATLLQQASAALNNDDVAPAVQLLDQALRLAPRDVRVQRLAGIAAAMAGEYTKAIEHLRNALAQRPDDVSANVALGRALVASDQIDAGLVHMHRACTLDPTNVTVWYSLGTALQSITDLEGARDAFKQALAITPDFVEARNRLAHVLLSLGDAPAAADLLRGTLRLQPDNLDAWITLGNLKTEALDSNDIKQLQNLLGRPNLPADSRIGLGFTLATALEDQSDYPAAFDALVKANALRRCQITWSRTDERARVDAIAQAFEHPLPASDGAALGGEVIFVVSLPRAASTLTEQILASHRDITGGDELQILPELLTEESRRRGRPFPGWVSSASAAEWHALGEAYLARAGQRLHRQTPRFTDKTIDNWAFVGAALAMLPGACVVNSRRDVLETSFACYRQWFPNGCYYSYDLDDMAAYCAGYERLCDVWRRRFPRRWLDHDYEALQADMEAQVRRLLAFCGLPFDPACLAFHETQRTIRTLSGAQVRQPLRHDTARGPLYGTLLDPLRDRLRAAGLIRTGTRSSP